METISATEAKKLVDEDRAVIIDVREPSETNSGKVKGAILLPISQAQSDQAYFDKIIDSIPKNKTIIVYCRSGARSGMLGTQIKKKGYDVRNMGGFSSWKNENFPID